MDPSGRPPAEEGDSGNIPGLPRAPSESNVGKEAPDAALLLVVYLVPGLRFESLGALYLGAVMEVVCPMCLVMVDRLEENLDRCDVVRDPPLNGAEDVAMRPWIDPVLLRT